MEKVLFIIKITINMRGGGKIIKRMEKVCSRGRMVQNMKVIT
jgi:hypothetical protein